MTQPITPIIIIVTIGIRTPSITAVLGDELQVPTSTNKEYLQIVLTYHQIQ